MLLLEIFSDIKMHDHENDDKHSRYDPNSDETVLKRSDTRKTRLTLEQINKIRRMQEMRVAEQIKDGEAYKIQYAPSAAEVPQM
tara:strand:- start:153 stop:404 length:252 start_codon:yes stop_codon:yes gene_type:complete